jgi:hypothetical protein
MPAPGVYDDGEIGGMMIGRWNRSMLGENLSQCHFIHQKPHILCTDANPGRRGGKLATNRLNYDTALALEVGGCVFLVNGGELLLEFTASHFSRKYTFQSHRCGNLRSNKPESLIFFFICGVGCD